MAVLAMIFYFVVSSLNALVQMELKNQEEDKEIKLKSKPRSKKAID